MSDRRIPDSPQEPKPKSEEPAGKTGSDPLELIEQCLALFSETDPRQKLLYKLRHAVMLSQAANQQREAEFKKVSEVVAKLTAPANRIGMLLEFPAMALRIYRRRGGILRQCGSACGCRRLKIGTQILVNEAYAVIKTLGYDPMVPCLKMTEAMPDGRLRFEQEHGATGVDTSAVERSGRHDLKPGDEVRIDPTHRIAIENSTDRKADDASAR